MELNIIKESKDFIKDCKEDNIPILIAIVGPTASGKTDLSIKLAKEIDGEIITADSHKVYKYMDIGTDKIHVSQMQGIKHHLLDIVDPAEELSLADYKRNAIRAINAIHRRKKIPILCGGTGLYINTIIQNYRVPKKLPQFDVRQQLAQYYEQNGEKALYELLVEKDPETASEIDPKNINYVIRALENLLVEKVDDKDHKMKIFTIGIDWPQEFLFERINRRVDNIIENGFLNEVKTLLLRGYNENMSSMSSLGYQEFIEFLKGDATLEKAIEKMKINTQNYSKRQLTWFRRYKDIEWIEGSKLEAYLKAQQGNS